MSKYKAIRSFRDGNTSYTQGKIYELDDEKASKFCIKRLLGKVSDVIKTVKSIVETAEKIIGNNETATKNHGKDKK